MAKLIAVLIVCLSVSYTLAQAPASPFGSGPGNQQPPQQGGNLPPQQQPKNEGPVSPGGGETTVPPTHEHGAEPVPPTTTGAPLNGSSHQNGTVPSPSHEKLTDKSGAGSFVVASSLLMVVVAPILL